MKVIGVGVGRGTKSREAAVTTQGRGRKDLTLAESHTADSVWV
jgi:hypothetical protein